MYPKYCKIKNAVLSLCDTNVNNQSRARIQSFQYSIIESSPIAHGLIQQQRSSGHLSQYFTQIGKPEKGSEASLSHVLSTVVHQTRGLHQQMKLHASNNLTPSDYKGQACRKIHSWHLVKAEQTLKFQIFSSPTTVLPAATSSVVTAPSNSFSFFIIASPFQQLFVRQLFHKS